MWYLPYYALPLDTVRSRASREIVVFRVVKIRRRAAAPHASGRLWPCVRLPRLICSLGSAFTLVQHAPSVTDILYLPLGVTVWGCAGRHGQPTYAGPCLRVLF